MSEGKRCCRRQPTRPRLLSFRRFHHQISTIKFAVPYRRFASDRTNPRVFGNHIPSCKTGILSFKTRVVQIDKPAPFDGRTDGTVFQMQNRIVGENSTRGFHNRGADERKLGFLNDVVSAGLRCVNLYVDEFGLSAVLNFDEIKPGAYGSDRKIKTPAPAPFPRRSSLPSSLPAPFRRRSSLPSSLPLPCSQFALPASSLSAVCL